MIKILFLLLPTLLMCGLVSAHDFTNNESSIESIELKITDSVSSDTQFNAILNEFTATHRRLDEVYLFSVFLAELNREYSFEWVEGAQIYIETRWMLRFLDHRGLVGMDGIFLSDQLRDIAELRWLQPDSLTLIDIERDIKLYAGMSAYMSAYMSGGMPNSPCESCHKGGNSSPPGIERISVIGVRIPGLGPNFYSFASIGRLLASLGRGGTTTASRAALTQKVINNATHIFGNKNLKKHKLEGLLKTFSGDKVKAYLALQGRLQTLATARNSKGLVKGVVTVNGYSVVVRGAVVAGSVTLSTAFIP